MKRIMLLGANGQLGTDLCRVLQSKRYELIPITRKQLDVEHAHRIPDFFSTFSNINYVINCTSYHKTDEAETNFSKAFKINTEAVAELAKQCHRMSSTLIHISTDYVFDGKKRRPYTEKDLPGPLNVYGNSKLAGEYAVQAYHDKYFIFRVSSLFGIAGSSNKGGNFVETMLRLSKQGQTIQVVNDQRMSPTHTLDVAKAIETFIRTEMNDYGIYHCSGQGSVSWYEFATEIFVCLGKPVPVVPVPSIKFPSVAKRPKYSVLDNAKLNRFYGMPRWQDALREYMREKFGK